MLQCVVQYFPCCATCTATSNPGPALLLRTATLLFCSLLFCIAGIAGAGDPAAPPAPALAYAEQLACALIASLGGGPGPAAAAAPQDSLAPSVASLADELLEKLLQAFPALYHSQACYSGLLVQLQQEEGDVPLGQVCGSSCAWKL